MFNYDNVFSFFFCFFYLSVNILPLEHIFILSDNQLVCYVYVYLISPRSFFLCVSLNKLICYLYTYIHSFFLLLVRRLCSLHSYRIFFYEENKNERSSISRRKYISRKDFVGRAYANVSCHNMREVCKRKMFFCFSIR